MRLYLYDRAGNINFTELDFGSDNAYVYDYDLSTYGYGTYGLIIEFVQGSNLKKAGILYTVSNGVYYLERYDEVVYNPILGRYLPEFEVTNIDITAYSLSNLLDEIVYAINNHRYLVSGNDQIYGNNSANLLDAGRGNDYVDGKGGIDLIWPGAGNDTVFGGAGNDIFYTTDLSSKWGGIDIAYGEGGTNGIYYAQGQQVYRLVDVWGQYFSPGTEYIRIIDGNNTLRASSIDILEQQYDNVVYTVDNFNDYYYAFVVLYKNIPNQNFSSNDRVYSIDLGDYLATVNYNETTKYSFTLSNNSYSDQFSLSDGNLKVTNGSGTTRTVDVTISAVNGSNYSNDIPTKDTFRVTFKDNNNSSTTYSGTSGNDTRTLTSGNDTWQVGFGVDKINGGSGSDTINVPNGSKVIRSTDVDGSYTGIKDKDYLYIELKEGGAFSGNNYTVAYNFEKIKYGEDSTENITSYYGTHAWDVSSLPIGNKNLSDNSSLTINFDDYFFTRNEDATLSYSYSVPGLDGKTHPLLDQIERIVPSYGNIKGFVLNSGTQKTYTVDITVTATQSFGGNNKISLTEGSDSLSESITFSLTMQDDDISGTSGDDTLTLTSGNDTFTVTTGRDKIDGGAGTDTLIVNEASSIIYSVDKTGFYTGTEDESFIYVRLGDDRAKYTTATNFEKIQTSSGTFNLSNFSSPQYWGFANGEDISDQTLGNNSTKEINLDDYLYHFNHPSQVGISYSATSDNSKLSDQISISDGILKLSSGSSGPDEIVNITVTAVLVDNNVNIREEWESATISKTFSVTMKDDDYAPETINYSLSANATSVDEGSKVSFTITGDKTSETEQTFNYSIEGDSNGETVDKALSSDITSSLTGTVKIPSGSTSVTFDINIASDSLNEGIEGFKLTIKNSEQATIDSKIILINNVEPLVEGYQLSSSKNEYGPNLIEYSSTSKSSGTLNHTSANEIIIATGQAKTLRGSSGDDTYILSELLTTNSKIEIVDTEGKNTIQIPDNTKISKVLFASNAAKIWLGNNQEITIRSADKFTYNMSGNAVNGDEGESFTYTEFIDLFDVEADTKEHVVNLYTKSETTSSNYKVVDISASSDKEITATSVAEEFRYEINAAGISQEGEYSVTINDFDKSEDKLTLVITDGTSSLTTQEFDSLNGVEVTSDALSGTQIFFAADSNGQSGALILSGIEEDFNNTWEAETYTVSILPETNLTSSSSDDLSYSFSNSANNSKVILTEFNSSNLSGSFNSSDQSEIIIVTGQGKTIRGSGGDDTYIISNLIPKNSGTIQITDTEGSNTIQIPDNTYIESTQFTKNASLITLKDGKEIKINKADTFTYNLGANIISGDTSEDLTFSEFASAFGVDNVLDLSGSLPGTISDNYII